MHKEKIESMIEENRKLINEGDVLKKTVTNQAAMVEVLEKQKANLEKELSRYTKVKVKSHIQDAELHQKRAMQEISQDGAHKLR
jgi:predicted nuclease with TOPRIM domain